MKQTRLWLLTMAVLLCSVTQLQAATIYLNDWTSTNKTNNSTSYETYTFTTYPGGSLSFDWYVSSESGYDWLTITLDGTQIVHQSGNSYSGNYSNENLSEGDHTLVVQYSKDGSQSNGSDLARITNIVVDEGYMDEVIQDGVSYRLSGNGTASVYALVDVTMSEVTIPSEVVKEDVTYSVTSIGSSAFANSNSIVSVSIPESVTTIENKAFYYCENLIDVTIMGSLTKLGDYAFQYCTKLENLTFVGGLTNIGMAAISHCNMLKEVSLPEGVEVIDEYVFDNSGIESIVIPASVTSIGNYAFNGCASLKEIIVADGANTLSLGYNGSFGLFSSCPLETIYLGRNINYNSNSSYGYSPFYNKDGLTTIEIGDSVTTIGDYAFYECDSIASITIPASVTSIGNYAFYACRGLREVTFVDGVNTLSLGYNGSYGLFSSCPLETIYLGRNLSYSYGSSYGYSPFYNRDALTSVVIGDNVTSIGNYAFYSCDNLSSLTIGDDVTSIGNYAFQYCSDLSVVYNRSDLNIVKGNSNYGYVGYYANQVIKGDTLIGDYYFYTNNYGDHNLSYYAGQDSMIVLPASYNGESYAIANDAFYNNDALVSVVIGDSVTSIGSNAFYSCSNLASLTIGDNVTSIGSYAFQYCNSLSMVYNRSDLNIVKGNSSYGYVSYYANQVIKGDTLIGDYYFYTTNDGDHYLSYYAGQDSMIVLPASYNGESYAIANNAFYDNDALVSVVISDSVTSIGSNAFYSCGNLVTVTIGDDVTSIGSSAFSGCNSLSSITIPASVTSINNYAFDNCTGITEVTFADGTNTLSLGYGYSYGLFDNSPLESVYLGRNLSFNTTYYSPFYNRDALTSVVIGDSVTSIGSNAFYSCDNLATVTIGDNVTSIDSYAFENCYNLSVVYNRSALNIIKGNSSYGYIGYYADQVIKVDNIVDDYYFYTTNDGDHYLSYYAGQDSMIILPASYNGESYAIANEAFYNNDALVSVVISDSVTSIGSNAFYSCGNLSSLTIPSNVTSVGDYAFDDCVNLKEVTIADGSNALSMGYYVFVDCPLETVHLGRNLTYSTDNSNATPFYNKDLLSRLTLSNNVTSIGSYAFSGCDSIYLLTVHSGITSIGYGAFGNLNKVVWLTNTPPEGYTNANGAINFVSNEQYGSLNNVRVYPYLSSSFDVDGLKYVPVNPAERTCNVIDCAYDSIASIVNVASNVSYRGVAMKVAGIESYAFAHNKYVEEVTISHEGNIGDQAFYDCDGLQNVTIEI